ncbi:MAG: Asp-tRNA(Asn)/Glu-tRNA(Gln) amidotransferase subunit GatC [Candidatus Hinthialibacter antarcticus]|nr:Asp-tRNA(Asn)/Glu-tRNA(Gln) amidotransferase subunit GatC [Candidatus Hinthialibacter antarcticus]
MSISSDELKHIALLSRLELTDDEAELYTQHIGEVLDYVEKLNELDVTGVEATSHAVPMQNIMRDDVIEPGLEIDESLKNAAEKEERYFRVPRVTE